jgi:hypothetical protein
MDESEIQTLPIPGVDVSLDRAVCEMVPAFDTSNVTALDESACTKLQLANELTCP